MLDRLGVPRAAYDDVVTSGDAARGVLAARPGVRIYHVGPERDLPIYFGLKVEFADEDDCELVSCTGLFDDENETPDDYVESFDALAGARRADALRQSRHRRRARRPPGLVRRRARRALSRAQRRDDHRRQALCADLSDGARRARRDSPAAPIDKASVLAVGDGIDTDIRGAVGQGIDVAFVTGGIHAAVFGDRDAAGPRRRPRLPRRPPALARAR